jgi:hypothetical protein
MWTTPLRGRLGDSEREAMALAAEVAADAILLDDRPARRAAEAAGLTAIGHPWPASRGILGRRALPAGRLDGLGASPDL